MDDLCLRITEDAFGASGPMDWFARIDSASAALVDWVYEYLADECVHLDERRLAVVRRMVAVAMLAQHDYDAKMWGCVVEEIEKA